MPAVRAHVFVSGRVQGVWYRKSTQARARELGLTGWVRNLPDGRVELVARGPRARIDKLVAWCRKGPPMALVEDVRVQWDERLGVLQVGDALASDFEIRR